MSAESKRSHTKELLASLRDPHEAERFLEAVTYLQPYLVLVREVSNGKDFLFSGPEEGVRNALRSLTELEPHSTCHLQLDYAWIEGYFLLRVVGSPECQDLISSYFPERPG